MGRDYRTAAYMEENKVAYIETESPYDTDLIKAIKHAMAKEERDKIRVRVKDALVKIKSQIEKQGTYTTKDGKEISSLGTPENLTEKSRQRSIIVRRAKAISHPNNVRAYAVASRLRSQGEGFKTIADHLNSNSFQTSRGGIWYPTSVSNLIDLFQKEGL
jgi:DNA invertase Pin-like site-specific DNA recombinase